jgi:hypothetical protein
MASRANEGGVMTSKNLLVRSGNSPGLLSNTTMVVFKTLLQDLEIESVANICLWCLQNREVSSDRTKPGRGLVPTCSPGYDVTMPKTVGLPKVGYKGTECASLP